MYKPKFNPGDRVVVVGHEDENHVKGIIGKEGVIIRWDEDEFAPFFHLTIGEKGYYLPQRDLEKRGTIIINGLEYC